MTCLRIATPGSPEISELAYLTPLCAKSPARSSAIHIVTVEGTCPISFSNDLTTSKRTRTLPELQHVLPALLKRAMLSSIHANHAILCVQVQLRKSSTSA